MEGTSCYCCPKPDVPKANHSAMELDSALNELGMLSSVTDSRKQYIQEKNIIARKTLLPPRGRNLSESCLSGAGTPSNSPTKGIYQIVQLNTDFVTSLSAGLSACKMSHGISCSTVPTYLKPDPVTSAVRSSAVQCLTFGDRYKQEELEQDARANRLSRLRISRVKRFRKPYELPWRRSLEQTYSAGGAVLSSSSHLPATTSLLYSVNQDQCSSTSSSNSATPFICVTAERTRQADNLCNSNASTPEKCSKASQLISQSTCTVTRSKSLDDLDISKLQLVESQNHNNFFQERQEIDTVSDHLRDMHVSGLAPNVPNNL